MTKNNSKIINLGCRLNFFESEVIKNILDEKNIDQKIVINTCAVTNQAVRKSINEVKKASKNFPKHQILVTGCASQIEKKKFSELTNVSRIIDNSKKTEFESYIGRSSKTNKTYNFPYFANLISSRSRATLQIQQGCDHRCTFCIIPYGRGDSKSLPFEQIFKRTENILNQGYSEITFTGVDLTSYGSDLPGKPKLGNIIKRLLFLQPKLKRLRLSSIDPAEIDRDLLNLLCNENRLLPHLHLSLQSGDNLILKRMKRRHNREQVISLCNKLKSARPEFTFGADVIVGFPTEKDQNFLETLNLIKKCNFSNVHIFPYSSKEGTPASRMPQVSERIKKERVKILREESSKVLYNQLNNVIGKSTCILFESNKKSYTDEFFKVKIPKEINATLKSGSFVNVTIISRKDDMLIAEILK